MEPDGKVYLIGAGPGDPGLLTVKAQAALRQADVVLYDRLVSPEILAEASPDALIVYAGKHAGEQEAVQPWIVEQMARYARQGKTVVRLKGGDPFVFGRGGEEWRDLNELGVAVEVIPGISSALSVPALAGIPPTFRGVARGFAIITGHCRQDAATDWARYAAIDTLIVLMGVSGREAIASALIGAGRAPEEPAAFIERGSTRDERVLVTTLAEVAAGEVEVEPPAVFVIGEVVRLREELTGCGEVARALAQAI